MKLLLHADQHTTTSNQTRILAFSLTAYYGCWSCHATSISNVIQPEIRENEAFHGWLVLQYVHVGADLYQ